MSAEARWNRVEEQQVRGIPGPQTTCFGGEKYGSEITNARNIPRKSGL